jgi:hypothetical protein
LGNDYLFGELAQGNLEQIRAGRSERRWFRFARTACARWAWIGKSTAARWTLNITAELLARHRDRLPLPIGGEQKTMVFHDACYLGRYRGVYDEPRDVIARFGEGGRSAAGARTRLSAAAAAGG